MKLMMPFLVLSLFTTSIVTAQSTNAQNHRGNNGLPMTPARPKDLGRPLELGRPSPQSASGRIANLSSIPHGRSSANSFGRFDGSRQPAFKQSLERRPTAVNERLASRDALPAIRKLNGPDRAFQERIAAADRMRDKAIQSNNVVLLERADELDRKAREQYQRMITQRDQLEEPSTIGTDNQDDQVDPSENVGRQFGQAIAARARAEHRGFGQATAERARELGREFGASNADKTRGLPPTAESIPDGDPLSPNSIRKKN